MMKQMRLWLRLMGIGLISFCIWGSHPVAAQGEYHIAFVSNRDGNDEIYVMDADGRQPTNISRSRARDWHPDWSPDGQQIVFTSDRDGNQELYVMNNNGTDQQNLTNSPKNENSPAWSPEGTRIVFGSDRDGGQDLYTIDVKTKIVTRLTKDGTTKSAPAWSPDSKQVVYWQNDGATPHIFAVDVATGEIRRLTDQGSDNWPAWSPDGGHIIYENKKDANSEPEILSLNLADNSVVNLTNNRASDIRPAWSPDGKQIVFVSNRDGSYDLYVMNADGSLPHRVLALNGDEQSPAWQPVPAPINMTDSSGVTIQSYTKLDLNNLGNELNDQKVLGGGDMRLIAPTDATTNQIIKVRLEIDPLPIAEATPEIDTPVPTPTPNPNIASASQREQLYLDSVYLIMGAQLTGIDLDRFKISPDPSEYVLRLSSDEVNYWEWTLRPKGSDTIGTNFLTVELYAPQKAADGSIEKTVLQDVDFQINVTNAAGAIAIPPTATPFAPLKIAAQAEPETTTTPDDAAFSIVYSDPDSFTIVVRKEVKLNDLRIASSSGEEWIKGFSAVTQSDFVVQPGTCLQYYRYQSHPPLYHECDPNDAQRLLSLSLLGTDVFWYNTPSNRFLQTIVKYGQEQLGVCDGGDEVCNFSVN